MEYAPKLETMAPSQKGRHLEQPHPQADTNCGPVFEALLYPNRSLSKSGFMILMSIMIGMTGMLGISFTLAGAWPVFVFSGLTVLLLWFAFKINFWQGRLHEHIRISANGMHISRMLPSGDEMRWFLQPYWTDIDLDNPVQHESQIKLRSKGKTLVIGSFLSPGERADFAKRLRDAIFSARQTSLGER